MQADDIAWVRFFNVRAIARHKGQRVGNHYVLADTHLTQLHAFFIFAGHHPHESHAVAVFRIHVGLNFKHEAGEFLFRGGDFTRVGVARHRRRGPLHQAIQHMVNAEVT